MRFYITTFQQIRAKFPLCKHFAVYQPVSDLIFLERVYRQVFTSRLCICRWIIPLISSEISSRRKIIENYRITAFEADIRIIYQRLPGEQTHFVNKRSAGRKLYRVCENSFARSPSFVNYDRLEYFENRNGNGRARHSDGKKFSRDIFNLFALAESHRPCATCYRTSSPVDRQTGKTRYSRLLFTIASQ